MNSLGTENDRKIQRSEEQKNKIEQNAKSFESIINIGASSGNKESRERK